MGVRFRQRGGAAIEFALILPVLVVFVTGTMEYGWFFWQESMVTNALRDAVRVGSYQAPVSGEGAGRCAACLSKTAAVAKTSLASFDITVTTAQVTPTIESIAGTCAIVLQPNIPYTPLIDLVPAPSKFGVRLVSYAQSVTGC